MHRTGCGHFAIGQGDYGITAANCSNNAIIRDLRHRSIACRPHRADTCDQRENMPSKLFLLIDQQISCFIQVN